MHLMIASNPSNLEENLIHCKHILITRSFLWVLTCITSSLIKLKWVFDINVAWDIYVRESPIAGVFERLAINLACYKFD